MTDSDPFLEVLVAALEDVPTPFRYHFCRVIEDERRVGAQLIGEFVREHLRQNRLSIHIEPG